MGIQAITETRHQAPAIPVPAGASGGAAPEPKKPEAREAPSPKAAAPAAPPPPPPPPPRKGFNMDVMVGYHEATNTKVYSFVDPDSGDTVVQIPMESVLNMVAGLLEQLKAQGKR